MRYFSNRKLELLLEISYFWTFYNFGKFRLGMTVGRGIETTAITDIAEKSGIVKLLIDGLETSIWMDTCRRLIWRLHRLSITILFRYEVSL